MEQTGYFLEEFNSGYWAKQSGYSYFTPSEINKDWRYYTPELSKLLEEASVKLGELKGLAAIAPDLELFISLHVKNEAVLSSKIEGTQTTLQEALLPESEILPERRDDWAEVQNYVNALGHAIRRFNDLPFSSRLIKEIHAILMDGVRGKDKQPGEFRKSQNWIGGKSLQDAVFVPCQYQDVGPLMSDLELFLHNDQIAIPKLLRIGMAHYQFETIHPFLDGNGRVGRLMIPLYLVNQGLLNQPLLYLSSYFESDRRLYYDNLTMTRSESGMIHWLKYFLVGISQTADDACQKLKNAFTLKQSLEKFIRQELGRRALNGLQLLELLFKRVVVTVKGVSEMLAISFKAASDLVDWFVGHQILVEYTGQSRNRAFVFKQFIQLYE